MGYLQTRKCRGKKYSHVKSNSVPTQFFNSIVKDTPMEMLKTCNMLHFSSYKNNAIKIS